MKVRSPEDVNPLYKAQGHVYMHLYQSKKFIIRYCLVDTPDELIEAEQRQRRFFFKLGADSEQADYIEIADQIERNHKVSHIDAHRRVKSFEFEWDQDFFDDLVKRCHIARQYYKTIRL